MIRKIVNLSIVLLLLVGYFPQKAVQASTTGVDGIFQPGDGYAQGAYDGSAIQPTADNWSRQSRYIGPAEPLLRWGIDIGGKSILSSPVIAADGTVYIGSDNGNLAAYTKDGDKKWVISLGTTAVTSPVIGADQTIYVYARGYLFAITPEGNEKWRYKLSGYAGFYSSPAIGKDGIIYINDVKVLYALSPDGTLNWKTATSIYDGRTPVIGKDGTIYLSESSLQAFSPDGFLKWNYTILGSYLSSPTIGKDGMLYLSGETGTTYSSYLFAVDPNGRERWRFSGERAAYSSASPAVAEDGSIYYTVQGGIYAVSPDGTEKWNYLDDENDMAESSPIIDAEGSVHFGNTSLYAVKSNGTLKWKKYLDSGIGVSAIAIGSERQFYVGTSQGSLYCYRDNLIGIEFEYENYHILDGFNKKIKVKGIQWEGTEEDITNLITFTSVNKNVIVQNGILIGETAGSDTITASYNGLTTSVPVTVQENKNYFNQNEGGRGGFQSGAYDMEAIQAASSNWTRQSRFTGPETVETKWKFKAGGEVDYEPVIGRDGTLYVGSEDMKLYAINPNGTEKWTFQASESLQASPTIGVDGTIYFTTFDGYVFAVNPDGTEKWRFDAERYYLRSSVAIGADGTLYVGAGYGVVAIHPDGTKKWYWEGAQYNVYFTPVIGMDGTIYAGAGDGCTYAINPDGTLKWRFRGGDVASPMVGKDGTIYFPGDPYITTGEHDNAFLAVNPNGTLKWSVSLERGSVDTDPVMAADGTIYIGQYVTYENRKLNAINPNGTMKWTIDTQITDNPLIGADGTIYFGTNKGDISAVNPDGSQKWIYYSKGSSSPVIGSDGTLYFSGDEGNVYALNEDTNPPDSPIVEDMYDFRNYVVVESEPFATIRVYAGDVLLGSGNVATEWDESLYYIKIPIQKAGTVLTVTATDKYGRVSEATNAVVKDVTPPAKPEVNEVTDKDPFVTGKSEAGSLIEVSVKGTVIGNGTTGEDGKFTVTIPIQKMDTELIVIAKDAAGSSESTSVIVKDGTPPAPPLVSVNEDATVISVQTDEPNQKVVVTVGTNETGITVYEGFSDVNGTYSVTTSSLKAGTIISVFASDKAGNQSNATTVVVKDVMAPGKPVVNQVSDKDAFVTGVAEAGSTVDVSVDGQIIGTGFTSYDGKFSVSILPQKADKELVITAKDKAGNVSIATILVVKDATAPGEPVVNQVTETDTSVTGTGEAGSKVEVKVTGESAIIGSNTVGEDGKFTVVIPVQKYGTELVVTVTDKAGNRSNAATVMVKDVTPPAAPVVQAVTDQSTAVSGTTEPRAKVTVRIGVQEYTEIADEDGNFRLTIPVQKAGTQVTISVMDAAGNRSNTVTEVVKDVTPPSAPIVKAVTDQSTTVFGTTEPGAKVTVKIGAQEYTGIADEDGSFRIVISVQKAGTLVTVSAADEVGNTSEAATVTVKDVTLPEAPAVDDVTDQATTVSGATEPGAKVTVKISDQEYTGFADENGRFSITIPVQKADIEITVIAADTSGNTSEPATVTVRDDTPPPVPLVKVVTDQSLAVSGTTEADAKISVEMGDQKYTGIADDEGKFNVIIPVQKADTLVTVFVTDEAGNISEAAIMIVKDVTPPSVPKVNAISDQSTLVTGTAEAGATVMVTLGSKTYKATSDVKGSFKVLIPKQKAGTRIIISASDIARNVSAATTQTVMDKTAPALPTMNPVSDKSREITGKAEPGTTVKVLIGSQKYAVRVDSKGIFRIAIPVKKAGTKILITATDQAGNVSKPRNMVVIDKTAPSAPSVSTVKPTTTLVTGRSEAYAVIVIKVGNKVIGTGKADKSGKFQVNIKRQKKKTILSVTAQDRSKNISRVQMVPVTL